MLKIASWNVNSVRARLALVTGWLAKARPDIVLLQEIKTTAETFPREPIEDLGYNIAFLGQKTYNGVAILSRSRIEDVVEGLPGDANDLQARYIEARTAGLLVSSLYVPNGNPAPGEKFDYKRKWLDRLYHHVGDLLADDDAFVLGGDYNVAPEDRDVYDPEGWRDDALCRPEARAAYRAVIHRGLTDAYRALHPNASHAYTFWDYQAGAWQRDNGLRIDHLLLSPQAADRLAECSVERAVRGAEKASDHAPIWCTLGP